MKREDYISWDEYFMGIALLTAMKPFLKPERYAKVDKAVQIARLSRVIRAAFQLFKKSGEEEADV